jgi:ornithine cyclodeaminase/alanine dehydrogenase-like protein (mu-crystallin family)
MRAASLPYVNGDELEGVLPYPDAVDALAAAFAGGRLGAPPRIPIELPTGELLLMPAFGGEGVGVKVVTLNKLDPGPGRPLVQGVFVLFSADGLGPELIIDGGALTARRTAAVSALATARLANPGARRLVVFGAGRQARAHVDAMRAVRPIESVGIVGRDSGRAQDLAGRLRREGLDADVVNAAAVETADVVCTCTTSATPLFDDGLLAAGAHINAVGAYRLDMREIPAATLARGLLAVETREAAMAEAGDIAQAIDEGAIDADHIAADLSDLAAGRVRRTSRHQITVFKSVGIADEDLVLARAICRRLTGPDQTPGASPRSTAGIRPAQDSRV